MVKRILFGVTLLLATGMLTSCEEEGCTDPAALNYNVVADKNDGSCVYCSDIIEHQLGQVVGEVIDNRFGTEYYEEAILEIEIIQKEQIYPYVDCGQSGCFFDVYAKNIIDKDIIQLQYYVSIPNTNGFSYSYNQWMSIALESGEDTLITNVLIALSPQQYWPINNWNEMYAGVNSGFFQ